MSQRQANREVLLVSRPIAPAVHDGTVELVRTLACQGPAAGVRFRALTPVGAPPPGPGVATRAAALPGRFASTAWRPISFLSLALAPSVSIRHYFFTPTPKVVSLLGRLHRLRPGPTVQTICSAPPDGVDLAPLVFADRVVALSSHTRDRLLGDGVAPERVWHIPPAVRPIAGGDGPQDPERSALRRRVRQRLGLSEDAPLVLYLGDFDVAGAALAVADALPEVLASTDAHAVVACRPKGARHVEIRGALLRRLQGRAPSDRVHLPGTIHWAAELAAGADVALFPAARLPDKMDLPLALLESLTAGVPAVVSDVGPLADLVRADAAVGVAPDDAAALATQTVRLLKDADARREASEGGRRWCREVGSPAALGAGHRALYASLLDGPEPD